MSRKNINHKKEVILMDIKTCKFKSYDSISSLANEFGLTTATITSYIKRNTIFRKKYYIFLKNDLVPNIEDRFPYYLKQQKINMYAISGKYIKTFDNLKDIKYYLVDDCCNGNLYDFHYSYKDMLKIIDKDNRSIYNYMLRSFKNNEDCKDIEPYKYTSGLIGNTSIVMTDLNGNIIDTYKSVREAAKKCKGLISYVTIQKILSGKILSSKGYIFKRISNDDLEKIKISGRLESIVTKKSLLNYKDEILESNLSDNLKDKLIKFLEQ